MKINNIKDFDIELEPEYIEIANKRTPFNYHTRKPSANGEKQSVPARAINQDGTATSENTQQNLGGWLN
jgi:hypothetical protein